MKTLVTGGAGFIGTHLVRALAARGDEVVVLDSLEEQVHHGVAPELPDGVELIVGNVGDAELADRALAGVDRVVHLAAAVGVGQSMYEIARYTELNTMATARFLERVVAQRPMPVRLVVASSMSIYGEGEYECAEHGRTAPQPAARGAAARAPVGARLPATAAPSSRPVGTSEAKPLIPTSIYAINKRDHEEMCLVTGAAYGIPAVALRFFNVYGPGQALSNPYTGVAAIFASRLLNGRAPVDLRGRPAVARLHPRLRHRPGHPARARDRGRRRPGVQPRHGPPDDRRRRRPRDLAPAWTSTSSREYREQYRAGDIRHCFADPQRAERILGFRAKTSFEDGMAELIAWLAGASTPTTSVDKATDGAHRREASRR